MTNFEFHWLGASVHFDIWHRVLVAIALYLHVSRQLLQ